MRWILEFFLLLLMQMSGASEARHRCLTKIFSGNLKITYVCVCVFELEISYMCVCYVHECVLELESLVHISVCVLLLWGKASLSNQISLSNQNFLLTIPCIYMCVCMLSKYWVHMRACLSSEARLHYLTRALNWKALYIYIYIYVCVKEFQKTNSSLFLKKEL